MADRDGVTVVRPSSMSSAHGTKAVGVDDEDRLTTGVPVILEGWRWLTATHDGDGAGIHA